MLFLNHMATRSVRDKLLCEQKHTNMYLEKIRNYLRDRNKLAAHLVQLETNKVIY